MHPISIVVTDLIFYCLLLTLAASLPPPHFSDPPGTLTQYLDTVLFCVSPLSRTLLQTSVGLSPSSPSGSCSEASSAVSHTLNHLIENCTPLPPRLIHRCPPHHTYTALLCWKSLLYSLPYYYGLNHGPKKDVKIPTPVPVNVTFLEKGSLQMSQFR